MLKSLQHFFAYVKLTLLVFFGSFLVVTILANRGNKTDVWLLWQFEQVPTLWLIAVTAATSVIAFWVLTRVRGLLREVRRLRAERETERRLALQESMARELSAQERRIDEKLRRAIGSGDEQQTKP